jgi:hypothetical protein
MCSVLAQAVQQERKGVLLMGAMGALREKKIRKLLREVETL